MSAQFGGDQYIAGQKEPVIDMPTRFVDFMRVLVPMAGDDTTPEGEQVNIYGNHVGSWNFAATAYLNRWKVKIYYEHYFDDHSQNVFPIRTLERRTHRTGNNFSQKPLQLILLYTKD